MSSFNVSTDKTFKNRSDSIFGGLESLEKKHEENIVDFDEDSNVSNDDSSYSRLTNNDSNDSSYSRLTGNSSNESNQGSNSCRNKSEERPSKANHSNRKRRFPARVPDHVLNPSSYKKYSLQNDGSGQIAQGRSAEQVNQKIALDLMNDLKKRNEDISDKEAFEDEPLNSKVTFHKPLSKQEVSDTSKVSLFGSSHGAKAKVMDTYEIGQKVKKKENIANTSRTSNSKEISLNFDKTDEPLKDDATVSHLEDDTPKESLDIEHKGFATRKKKNRMIRKRTDESVDEEN